MMIFTLKDIFSLQRKTVEGKEKKGKKINISRKDLLPRNYSINSSSLVFIPSWSSDDRKKKAKVAAAVTSDFAR